jgi:AraC-like DNA-binding protein
MNKAQAMLINGSNVKETALSLGFSNQNYFSARFKKYYGYSPSSVKKCK